MERSATYKCSFCVCICLICITHHHNGRKRDSKYAKNKNRRLVNLTTLADIQPFFFLVPLTFSLLLLFSFIIFVKMHLCVVFLIILSISFDSSIRSVLKTYIIYKLHAKFITNFKFKCWRSYSCCIIELWCWHSSWLTKPSWPSQIDKNRQKNRPNE